MFSKILIANRGEIAVRIIRACKEMGIDSAAIFSEADRESMHVSLAEESYCVGKAPAKDSYLHINNIISAAVLSKAEAIHPGYGFLSENPQFAELCEQNGIVFIGPSADVIALMGDKENARRTMKDAGVPIIPGSDVVKSADQAREEALKIGFPILLKARSGGGGKGIRLVKSVDDINTQFSMAFREAEQNFGDGSLYLEKFLSPVKHIEMQILADKNGHIVCLGERDCSVQRKKQKLLEESPAVTLTESQRAKMIEASVKATKTVCYTGVGTIEYLTDIFGNFYFMEMNTRLQVEHPVTEMRTGIDLVKWQIRVAAGMELDFKQEDIIFNGHAIECRVNAENPYKNFMPSIGKIKMLHIPGGPYVRFDTALYHGYSIPPYYDSMIGKLIVCAKTRDEATRKMKAALCELMLEGVYHNAEYQMKILERKDFMNGTYTTNLLERQNNDI